jgi:hypothetical protein
MSSGLLFAMGMISFNKGNMTINFKIYRIPLIK